MYIAPNTNEIIAYAIVGKQDSLYVKNRIVAIKKKSRILGKLLRIRKNLSKKESIASDK